MSVAQQAQQNGTGVIKVPMGGAVEFKLGDDGKPFTVDVIEVYNRTIDIGNQYGDGNEILTKYQDMIQELGGPGMTKYEASRFVQLCLDVAAPLVEELKKNSPEKSNSPGDSSPSATPSS